MKVHPVGPALNSNKTYYTKRTVKLLICTQRTVPNMTSLGPTLMLAFEYFYNKDVKRLHNASLRFTDHNAKVQSILGNHAVLNKQCKLCGMRQLR